MPLRARAALSIGAGNGAIAPRRGGTGGRPGNCQLIAPGTFGLTECAALVFRLTGFFGCDFALCRIVAECLVRDRFVAADVPWRDEAEEEPAARLPGGGTVAIIGGTGGIPGRRRRCDGKPGNAPIGVGTLGRRRVLCSPRDGDDGVDGMSGMNISPGCA
jgi:hypothetical protein